jgi:hypothetical protein
MEPVYLQIDLAKTGWMALQSAIGLLFGLFGLRAQASGEIFG